MPWKLKLMHEVWDSLKKGDRKPTLIPNLDLNDLVGELFSVGPSYYYIIDFVDMSVSHVSESIRQIHGIDPASVRHINDILSLVHPDDMEFVADAERKICDFFYQHLGHEKLLKYKSSYNLRFQTPKGYRLFNHQALVLTLDDKGNFIKSLNIHTDISDITNRNNHLVSLIGLKGEPSFQRMKVIGQQSLSQSVSSSVKFSQREMEIIRLLAEGLDTKQISEKLYISVETARTHRKNINRKSGCKNSQELIAKGLSEGWI